jgi:hypothetical protein
VERAVRGFVVEFLGFVRARRGCLGLRSSPDGGSASPVAGLKGTEWPTRDHSIKTLANYLGFTWRDRHPSGAASIEWFDRWCRERNPDVKKRILDYNEDDCRATRFVLDGIRSLTV